MNRGLLKSLLVKHEGLRLGPYRCTAGKLTIGVGRNLDDCGITEAEAAFMLDNDITRVESELAAALPWFRRLDAIRQVVLADMAFNLGTRGLLTFHRTLANVESGNYAAAADAMLASKWATQVSGRAHELADLMRNSPVNTKETVNA